MIDYKAQGKRNRAAGARFELKVRKNLEEQGFIVDKFTNNIDLENSCFVKAKQTFIKGRGMGLGSGFPDFIAFRQTNHSKKKIGTQYAIMLVECKVNGTLSKIEKLKMEWLHGEGFKCWVASKNGKLVEYKRPNKTFRKSLKYKA